MSLAWGFWLCEFDVGCVFYSYFYCASLVWGFWLHEWGSDFLLREFGVGLLVARVWGKQKTCKTFVFFSCVGGKLGDHAW